MKMAIAGSRGVPACYGGFETFAEEISQSLSERGYEVTVVCEKGNSKERNFGNVKLIYSNYSKQNNPLRFYYNSIQLALKENDLVIVCGVGGAIFYPLLRRKNKIIVTHVDGDESKRGKYSAIKKLYVRVAQYFAAKYSDHLIADALAIQQLWCEGFPQVKNKIMTVEFGAHLSSMENENVLRELNLMPSHYYLVVCRLVPENHVLEIVEGYLQSRSNKKLVIVGAMDNSKYCLKLKAFQSPNILFVGSIYEKEKLFSLRKNCFAYLHGHSVGGTNPSLLEAMATECMCICHGNVFNHEVTESRLLYFSSSDNLAQRIIEIEKYSQEKINVLKVYARQRIAEYYNWKMMTDKYVRLIDSLKR